MYPSLVDNSVKVHHCALRDGTTTFLLANCPHGCFSGEGNLISIHKLPRAIDKFPNDINWAGVECGHCHLLKVHETLGLFRSSKKKAIALFYMILHSCSRVSVKISGQNSLNGNLKDNGSIGYTEILPGDSLSEFLSIQIVFRGMEKRSIFFVEFGCPQLYLHQRTTD